MKHLLWILLFIGPVAVASSATPPAWIDNPPEDNSRYRYFTGVGFGDGEQQAFENAQRDALESCIREIYGFSAKIDKKTYETEKSARLVKRQVEASQDIQVKGFQRVGIYTTRASDSVTVNLLYRYDKAEIRKEMDRLSTLDQDIPLTLIAMEDESKQVLSFAPINEDYAPTISSLDLWKAANRKPNPWSFILYGIYSGKTVEAESFSSFGGGLAIEKRFMPIGIRISAEAVSASEPSNGNNDRGLKGTGYRASLAYYAYGDVNNNVFIEPQYGIHKTTLNASTKQSAAVEISQQSFGLALGAQLLLNDPAALEVKVGMDKYSDAAGYKGATPSYFTIGIVGKW